jgi:tetratricopeptide (TPR) repeat protein
MISEIVTESGGSDGTVQSLRIGSEPVRPMSRLARITLTLALMASFTLSSTTVFASYEAAQQLMARQDYVGAAAEYFQSYSSPRSAQEKAFSEWGLGKSLHALGFYYSSSKYFSQIVRRGPSATNPYFRRALEELGSINNTVALGQSHIVQLVRGGSVAPENIPGAARGFYFYYLGEEAFSLDKFEKAADYLKRVPSNSTYYSKAQFHLGVIANRAGAHSRAISYFETTRSTPGADAWVREQGALNIARVHYETKNFTESLQYYAQIPRESDNWLEAIFESAWAFFMMAKHNNVLGNIHTLHSPFFENRFFPESYLLEAITYLRLCRFDEVQASLERFRERYKPVFKDVLSLLTEYKSKKQDMFKLVYDYRNGSLNSYRSAWAILDSLSRSDAYKEAYRAVRYSDGEIAKLSGMGGKWGSTGLTEELKDFLAKKKQVARNDSGDKLYDQASSALAYMRDLVEQTRGIQAERFEGQVDTIRRSLNVTQANDRKVFIGGLQPLKIDQQLEYWPFMGEYWEDELGYYVYNLDDKCNVGPTKSGDAKK